MTDFLLRNSLNPYKVVNCTITFRKITNKGEEGQPVWLVQIATLEPHKDGGEIPPVFIHYTSSDNLDEAIREATTAIAAQVDWEPLLEDVRSPFVTVSSPTEGEEVSIYSNVAVIIKALLPAAGIDLSSIEMTVNGFHVTSEIEVSGDPSEYTVEWKPLMRDLDTY